MAAYNTKRESSYQNTLLLAGLIQRQPLQNTATGSNFAVIVNKIILYIKHLATMLGFYRGFETSALIVQERQDLDKITDLRIRFQPNGSMIFPTGFSGSIEDRKQAGIYFITYQIMLVLSLNETCSEMRKGFFYMCETTTCPYGYLFYHRKIWDEDQQRDYQALKWSQKLARCMLFNGVLSTMDIVTPISTYPTDWSKIQDGEEYPVHASFWTNPRFCLFILFWSVPGQYKSRMHLFRPSDLTGPNATFSTLSAPDPNGRNPKMGCFCLPPPHQMYKYRITNPTGIARMGRELEANLDRYALMDFNALINEVHRLALHEDGYMVRVQDIMQSCR